MAEIFSTCPVPTEGKKTVSLAHGGGGRLMHDLIEKVFVANFRNPHLEEMHDGAKIEIGKSKLAFSTDSYVVKPLFFPGGDIGKLAVTGTVNDLAMCGSIPKYLSAGFIIEEGFPIEDLERIAESMKTTAKMAGVELVTGDTKVVDKGKGDGVFINTAGIGFIENSIKIGPMEVRPGDAIILNGDIGRHGMAIMAKREGLAFETTIESDCALLNEIAQAAMGAGEVHCMRDLTRGGLATSLIEIANSCRLDMHIEENSIEVEEQVHGACELLGIDPLYVANEGRFVVIAAKSDAQRILGAMQSHEIGRGSKIIGHVLESRDGMVTITSPIGATRILDMLSGEQLPRIC